MHYGIHIYSVVFCFVGLKASAEKLIQQSVTLSTGQCYTRYTNKYKKFCRRLNMRQYGKTSPESVELWCAQLKEEGLGYTTIQSHLSALRHKFRRRGKPVLFDTDRLKLLMKGIKKSQVSTLKQPVTLSHLRRLGKAADGLNPYSAAEFRAMVSLAFYGFLRPSEFCISKAGHHLKLGDLKVKGDEGSCRLRFKTYKHSTTPTKVKIRGNGKNSCLDPASTLTSYLQLRGDTDTQQPLFSLRLHEFRSILSEMCAKARIKTKITPHCFRHGGATWACKQGWTDAKIQAHGRWNSNAYKRYIKAY